MILPGWQEELESLRNDPLATGSPVASEKRTPSAETTSGRPRYTPIPEAFSTPGQASSDAEQPGRRPGERSQAAQPPQREFSAQARGQEPASQPSQPPTPGPGPASAVEQTPFSALPFGSEEREEALADVDTVTWHVADQAPSTPKSTPDERATQAPEEKDDKEAVENLPTSALSVPPSTVKDQSQRKVEQNPASHPGSGPSAQTARHEDEFEGLPTRPMPASLAGPRSPLPASGPRTPLPPVAPQTPSMFADLPPLEGRPVSQSSNPPSSPGIHGPTPGFGPTNPPSQPGNPPSQPGRSFGPARPLSQPGNPPSQPGYTYGPANPPSRPGNPPSQPGNPPSRPGNPPSQPGNPPSSPGIHGPTPGFGPTNPPSRPGNPPSWAEAQPSWQSGEQGPASYARPSLDQSPSTAQPGQARATALGKSFDRKRILVGLALLVLIVGLVATAISYQHNQSISNQAVQPAQLYQNTSLGFSLRYPQAWKVSADQAHGSVHFADSSATVQVDLSRAAAHGSLAQYLNQKAAQLGITGQKAASAVNFAGESWQRLQGNVNQKGATYAITLYVAQHNGYFYALTCLTLPDVYAQAEHDSFAPLRSSLQFL